MPKKKVKRKNRVEQKPLWLLKYLALGEIPKPEDDGALDWFLLTGNRRNLKKVWEKYRDYILSDWIENRPGTRPFCWWRFDAPRDPELMKSTSWEGTFPVARKRLSGTGDPDFEFLSIVPSFNFGVPDHYLDQFQCDYYNGRAKDVHGNLIDSGYKEGHFKGFALDTNDPPLYENQASYLQRHGLLTKAEGKRLTDKDFRPESCLNYIKTYEK